MVDRRQVACRLPMASQRAASDREADCLAESYSESESLLERPTAESEGASKAAAPAPATPGTYNSGAGRRRFRCGGRLRLRCRGLNWRGESLVCPLGLVITTVLVVLLTTTVLWMLL